MSEVTACIPTWNEEQYIGHCLNCLRDKIDYIIILDEASTDRTLEIVQKTLEGFDYKVVRRTENRFFEKHSEERNYLTSLAPTDWVLHSDADELWLPELLEKGKEIIKVGLESCDPSVAAYRFPRINLPDFYNYPDYQVRLFNKDRVKWVGSIHQIPIDIITGKQIDQGNCIVSLPYPILHLPRTLDRQLKNYIKFTEENLKCLELDKDSKSRKERIESMRNDLGALMRRF